jgi:carbonic anhydrase
MHLVHYKQKYGSLISARNHSDGIVVLTVFLVVANDVNMSLEPLMKVLPKITHFNSSAIIHERLSIDKMLPFDRNFFYRYEGSLTTPPCSESVTFLLFANPIKISHFQVKFFKCNFDNKFN